jgi:hypothetical protein
MEWPMSKNLSEYVNNNGVIGDIDQKIDDRKLESITVDSIILTS